MPNWNYNSVKIYAPENQVKDYLVQKEDELVFNMHLLFPWRFPSSDPTGEASWNYDWSVENTGSKWYPDVYLHKNGPDEQITYLSYDTARAPNNLTLQRLHEITGWMIVNEYEEAGMCFEGIFSCIKGNYIDDEREYHPSCEICEKKKSQDCYDEDADDMICKLCRKEREAGD